MPRRWMLGLAMAGIGLALQASPLQPPPRLDAALDPLTARVEPGGDEFGTEQQAEELAARLEELSRGLRGGAARAREVERLLASDLRAGSLRPVREVGVPGAGRLEVLRSAGFDEQSRLDRAGFIEDFGAWLAEFGSVRAAEFDLVEIAVDEGTARTVVDFDLVGTGPGAWRLETAGRWSIEWGRGAGGQWQARSWMPLGQTRSRSTGPVFVDASQRALGANASFAAQLGPGVDYWRSVLDGAIGPDVFGNNGVAAGDFNGDGFDDLYVSQPSGLPNRLFRNRGDGTFLDVTEETGVGVLDATSASLFADVDNDGDQDLVVVTWRAPLLFVNDGNGRLASRPGAFRFARPAQGAFTSAALADFDRDGFLDLYVCAYNYFLGEGTYRLATPYHDARNGPANTLFRNDGQGNFLDVTREAGLDHNNDRFSFACAWGDYDGDGWPDLAVANDFGRKNLYRNEPGAAGTRVFRDVAAEAAVEDVGAGMSAAWLDYDNDGRLDLYWGNMWSAAGRRVTAHPAFQPGAPAEALALFRRHAKGNSLFRNQGDGSFRDVSGDARAERGLWAWSSDAIDFDADGWQDLYVATGFVTNTEARDLDGFFWRQVVARSPLDATPRKSFEDGWRAINRLIRGRGSWAGRQRNVLLRNDGTGGFDAVSGAAGLDLGPDGRAFATLDFDQDGDPDLALVGRTGPRLRLLRNDLPGDHAALAVRLTGRRGNRDAVGARVVVQTNAGRYVRVVQAGSGFLSQHSKELLFGLGASRATARVEVLWPGGGAEVVDGVPLNRRVRMEEGRGIVASEPFRQRAVTNSTEPQLGQPSPPRYTGTWLSDRWAAPDLAVQDLEGRDRVVSHDRKRPAVLSLWATSCTDCRRQLAELQQDWAQLSATGAELTAVSLDGPAGRPLVRARASELGLRFPVVMASPEAIATCTVLGRYLFDRNEDLLLPTTLLIDATGSLAKVYRGRADPAWILADLGRLGSDPMAVALAALPFPGAFHQPPPGRNYFQFGIAYAEQGLDAAAVAAFEKTVQVAPRFAKAHYNLGTLYARRGDLARARAAFGRALEAAPEDPEAHNNLGTLLAEQGQLDAAIAHFEAAVSARPDHAEALGNLGYAELQSGRAEKARALLERALALQPGLAAAHNSLGIYYGSRDDLSRARASFERALECRPRYAEALNNLAVVDAREGRLDEAVQRLEQAVTMDPAFESSYLTLARLHLNAGRRPEAAAALRRLLERNPRQPAARKMLVEVEGGPPAGREQ